MKRNALDATLLAVIAGLAAYQTSAPTTTTQQPFFAVARIVDGDTIDITDNAPGRKPQRYRLAGIDTPEVHNVSVAQPLGPEASAFAVNYLAGHRVRIVTTALNACDHYGRGIAEIWPEGSTQSLNAALIDAGLAWVDERWYLPQLAEYRELERNACAQGRGLWSPQVHPLVPAWRRQHPMCKDLP